MIQNEVDKVNILDAAARILNEEIHKIQRKKVPEKIKTKHLIEGECEVPETVNFYSKVLAGENYRRRQNKKTTRLAKSFSEDLIYAVFNGRIKLSKQICLGMTLKSLTNSSKIVNIVHRYGDFAVTVHWKVLRLKQHLLLASCPIFVQKVSYEYLGCPLESHLTITVVL